MKGGLHTIEIKQFIIEFQKYFYHLVISSPWLISNTLKYEGEKPHVIYIIR